MTSIVISPMRVLLGAALALLIGLLSPVAAFAADAAHGAQIFSANCAACHIGGGNVVNAERTLKQPIWMPTSAAMAKVTKQRLPPR